MIPHKPHTTSLLHTWPDRVLATLVVAVGVWLTSTLRDLTSTVQAMRETNATLRVSVESLQRNLDRVEARVVRLEDRHER
jgi:phage shock protein A